MSLNFNLNISLRDRGFILLGAGVVLSAAAAFGLYLFSLSDWFVNPGPYAPNAWEGYNEIDFVGLTLFNFFATTGIALIVVGLQALSAAMVSGGSNVWLSNVLPTMLLCAGLFVITGVSVPWASEILSCGVFFCTHSNVGYEVRNERPEAMIGWKADQGVSVIIAAFSLAVARGASTFVQVAGYGGVSKTKAAISPAPYYWACCIIVPIVTFIYFYISGTVPNNWEYHSKFRLARFYNQVMDSIESCKPGWGGSCPEFPGAWFITKHWRITSDLVVKIFPGNLFFYIYLCAVGVIAAAAHQVQWSRKFVQRRLVPARFVDAPLAKYVMRFTVGDAIISIATFVMVFLFFAYWLQSHNYNGGWSNGEGHTMGRTEHWARALGQLAVVFLSLLFFPASRNSIFHHPFGTHWESWLWTHRVLGTLMLAASFAHMIAWYVRFYELGMLSDIFSVPMKTPICIDNWTVPLATLSTWFMLLAIGIGALPIIRRKFFEVFYYLHLFAAYSSLPAILWHATAGWEYMLPGLTVWFIDRVIRFFRSGSPATVIDVTVFENSGDSRGGRQSDADANKKPSIADVVGRPQSEGNDVAEIRFRPAVGMNVTPGQYVFLNVPQVSVLEWHPYTLSTTGAPSDYLTVHIKGMGPGTWSDRVVCLCRSIQHVPHGGMSPTSGAQQQRGGGDDGSVDYDALNKLIQLSVDGPYGTPMYYGDYDQVVLVAGGIGITPCASILSGLRAAHSGAESGDSAGNTVNDSSSPNRFSVSAPLIPKSSDAKNAKRCTVRRAVLKWSVRSLAEVDALRPALATGDGDGAHAIGGGGRVTSQGPMEQRLTIHATRGLFLDPPSGFDVQQGRPNYEQALRDLCTNGYSPSNTLVFVCGPQAMMDDAVRAATAVGCHVHTEVFEL